MSYLMPWWRNALHFRLHPHKMPTFIPRSFFIGAMTGHRRKGKLTPLNHSPFRRELLALMQRVLASRVKGPFHSGRNVTPRRGQMLEEVCVGRWILGGN